MSDAHTAHTGPRTLAGMVEGESPFFMVVFVAVLYNLELLGRASMRLMAETLRVRSMTTNILVSQAVGSCFV